MVSTAAADAKQFDTTDRVLNSQSRFHRSTETESFAIEWTPNGGARAVDDVEVPEAWSKALRAFAMISVGASTAMPRAV
jgi:hypothetical protein